MEKYVAAANTFVLDLHLLLCFARFGEGDRIFLDI